jgi:hypothetical protein
VVTCVLNWIRYCICYFYTLLRSDRVWDPPIPLSSGKEDLSPGLKRSRGCNRPLRSSLCRSYTKVLLYVHPLIPSRYGMIHWIQELFKLTFAQKWQLDTYSARFLILIFFTLVWTLLPLECYYCYYCTWLYSMIHTHTLGRSPLDEGSAHRKNLYLTLNNNHKGQICMTTEFESAVSESERTRTDARMDRKPGRQIIWI